MRFYLDSNVYRFIKSNSKNYNLELHNAMEALIPHVLFCYSEAHLDDLSNTTKPEYIDEDLEIMSRYVKDNYFVRNHIKKSTGCFLKKPQISYYEKDYKSDININPLVQFDAILKELQQDDTTGLMKPFADLLNSMFSLPIYDMTSIIDNPNMDDRTKEMLRKMFPNPKPMMSLREIAENFLPYGQLLYSDKKELTELRKYSRGYFENLDGTFDKWGLEFSQKLKQSSLGQSFTEMIENTLVDDQKHSLYDKFLKVYTFLEIMGISTERRKNGIKEFDYKSLNTDATHAYFASYSDYLVTDDKGMQVKAYITYSLLNIKTKVLTIKEFIGLKNLIVNNKETLDSLFTTLKYDLDNAMQIEDGVNLKNGNRYATYLSSHHYFDYFNRVQTIDYGDKKAIALACERSIHANWFMYREIELVCNKLYRILGTDDDKLAPYTIEESKNKVEIDNDVIRSWTIGKTIYQLQTSLRNNGNFICLGIWY